MTPASPGWEGAQHDAGARPGIFSPAASQESVGWSMSIDGARIHRRRACTCNVVVATVVCEFHRHVGLEQARKLMQELVRAHAPLGTMSLIIQLDMVL